ncbi:TrbI/VirB10 family protein [Dendronalium sp. ChiSLP03b]|uniref:TrbI/VirB10 family protein n=1 Tax=Dendronalium sp. ChiSLP03b TaxID=3075381 RepID=UPI002AD52F64|nr:TrbI/VirB10 family protein [Dendronalium sp. ChiSLP03b]MDZ8205167.1 TrbI/VirB10 family protein [Dendronalium sp. ChiSLP03b]
MTSYSIPSEVTPKNLDTLTNRNSQIEDWESKMARLVGLQEESPTVDVANEESAESASLQSPISQPQEISTEQSLSSNPFAKLALVGSATLVIVMLAGVFLSQMMSSTSNQKSVKSPLVSSAAPSQPTSLSRQQGLELEVENLKTKLALAEQAQAMTVAQQNLRTGQTTREVIAQPTPQVGTSTADRDRLRMAQQTVPTPVRTVYVPRIVTVERRVENPSSQTQNPIAAIPSAPPIPVVNPNAKPSPPDPLQEWARLAKLGSYGEVSATSQSNSQPQNNANVPSQTINPDPNQPPQPPQPPNSVVSQAQSQSSKSVRVGTSAKAVLATAVFGETTRSRNNDKDSEEGKNVFVVRLKQPLKAVDGSIALPANTELLTQVAAISEQGLLQLDVVKVVSQNNGNLSETSLPSNAIIIRGTQGKPLMASKFPNSSRSIAGMDAGLFVLGGIGKAAELFNRSDTKIQCVPNTIVNSNNDNSGNTSYGSSCYQVTDTRRNIAAGIFEGGLNSLVPQISQRNQQAIAQMMQQTNVWFMPAGKEVEIYVNQSIQF